jgi:hypothetical protein
MYKTLDVDEKMRYSAEMCNRSTNTANDKESEMDAVRSKKTIQTTTSFIVQGIT